MRIVRVKKSLEARLQGYQGRHFERTKYGKQLAALKGCRHGETCVIVGNGPSLRVEDLQRLRQKGIATFGTNRIYKIFDQTDWRPTYYVSEDILLMRDAQKIIETMQVEKRFIPINLKWYEGIDIPNADYFYMEYFAPMQDTFCLSLDIPHSVRCRGTVTITCMQLAIFMGFTAIYLIGVDHNFAKMVDKDGREIIDPTVRNHFISDYGKGISSTDQKIIDQGFHVDQATEGYIDVEKLSHKLGTFRIYNATRGGKLEVFERKDFDRAFENQAD